ncbi:MAG: hypothetical protein HFI42_04555 [Lachnospiraceae bacterium]|nr:hypothetical protein [Lachnospiraceae bacterium]
MKELCKHILYYLDNARDKLDTSRIFAGFDGYIDVLAKPVQRSSQQGDLLFFETISEFGAYLQTKAAKSCSVELHKIAKKAGGNAVIFSQVISGLGVNTSCTGAFGYPQMLKDFTQTNDRLQLISVSEPGYCTALEFSDGKVMLGENGDLNELDYDQIQERVGRDRLCRLLDQADVIALMNWSEVPNSTGIWQGLLDHIFPALSRQRRRSIFIDISDCSRRCMEEIREMIFLLRRFAAYGDVTLSLNQNEFDRVAEALLPPRGREDTQADGKSILQAGGFTYLILHRLDGAMAFHQSEAIFVPNHRVASPVISTGGGDNFNAGFVFGRISGMDLPAALFFANAVSSYYVAYGRNPNQADMRDYICQLAEKEKGDCSHDAKTLRAQAGLSAAAQSAS